jgi:hypothetical protein
VCQCGIATSLTSNAAVWRKTTDSCVCAEWHAVLLQSTAFITSLINCRHSCIYIYTHNWFLICCCGAAPPWHIHWIINLKLTSKLRLCYVWKYSCRAKSQLRCITNSHNCTFSKLAVWQIRISQIGNYSISSSYSYWICMSCLLLSFTQKTTLLNVSEDTDAVHCGSKYANEQCKHYLK